MAYKIGNDKKKHFFVGIPLGLLLQYFSSYFFPVQTIFAITISLIILAAICYGFELLSLITGKGHADNLDAIAGILGGIIGIALYWCIHQVI
jgi:glycopeptide antibiotics resistance protein